MVAQILDPLRRQRMGAAPGITAVAGEHFAALQNLEEPQQAARRLAGPIEHVERGVVGRRLLGHRELQPRTLADPGGAEQRRTALPGHRCGKPRRHRDHHLDAGVACRLPGAHEVPAGNVAGLVRDHPEQLVRVLGPQDQPGIEEDRLTAGDE